MFGLPGEHVVHLPQNNNSTYAVRRATVEMENTTCVCVCVSVVCVFVQRMVYSMYYIADAWQRTRAIECRYMG